MSRPTWDEYFMQMAELAAKRSVCLRGKVGAIAVRDRHVLATGYNGPPKGASHCTRTLKAVPGGDFEFEVVDTTCIRDKLNIPSGERHELCRGSHAEQNVIAQAAYHGVSLCGSTIYCNFRPCVTCVKSLVNAGVKEVVYKVEYNDELAVQIARETGLILRKFDIGPKK
jgi:dCMP deaminase